MATRKPLVRIGGKNQQLPAADSIDVPGARFHEGPTEPTIKDYGDRWLHTTSGIKYTWVDPGVWVDLSEPTSADIAEAIHAATSKTTPVDADELGISDSADSWLLKKLTFANLKAWIAGLFVGKTGAQVMTGDLTLPSLNGGQLAGHRNKLINGNFQINQAAVSGTVTLAAGAYGHDMWKAGASGCTYTFSSSGGITTLTISAGSLIQVIEGVLLQTGTFVLGWSGTAQGKIGAGSYSSTGVSSSVTGGINLNIEFNTGTLSLPQFEPGTVPTSFEHRLYQAELMFCYRYAYPITSGASSSVELVAHGYVAAAGTIQRFRIDIPVTMRATPTLAYVSGSDSDLVTDLSGTVTSSFAIANASPNRINIERSITGGTTLTSGHLRVNSVSNVRLMLLARL